MTITKPTSSEARHCNQINKKGIKLDEFEYELLNMTFDEMDEIANGEE